MNAACQILREEFSVVVASESANPAVLGDEVPDTGNKGAVEAHVRSFFQSIFLKSSYSLSSTTMLNHVCFEVVS